MEMLSTLRNFPLDLFIDSRVGSYCFFNQPEGWGGAISRALVPFPLPYVPTITSRAYISQSHTRTKSSQAVSHAHSQRHWSFLILLASFHWLLCCQFDI